jgi:hypothetical protein
MSRKIIFQKLCVVGEDVIKFLPFVCASYAFEYPLFYSHRNHEGDVIIIPFATGICQSDLGGGGRVGGRGGIIRFSPF